MESVDSNITSYSEVNIQMEPLTFSNIKHHENLKALRLFARSGKFCARALDLHVAAIAQMFVQRS